MPAKDVDRDALERAMVIAAKDKGRAEQLARMLKDRPWRQVAEFAAYVCQNRALRLKPWQPPPCHASEDGRGSPIARDGAAARALLDRMLAAGLSEWEPDPLAALERRNDAGANR